MVVIKFVLFMAIGYFLYHLIRLWKVRREMIRLEREFSDDPLVAMKYRISRKYLGKAGIHAVGLKRSTNSINVYMMPKGSPEKVARTLADLRRDAAPYSVIVKLDVPIR